MTAYAGETGEADRGEAILWAAPTGALPAPPIDTRPQVLPIGELHWPDAEKLFLRLLDAARPVQFAKLFGVPGQAQAGIDAYARLPVELTDSSTGGRDYITLQSRRVKSLTAARIKKAVDDLLKGEWADKTSAFYFATSFDLQDTKLDAAIRQQTERLAKLKIAFVPWGVQEVSRLLKDHPRLVDDFFGRPWAERFCGPEAAQVLVGNLPRQDSGELRAGLRDLYQAVFSAQGGARPAENPESGSQFVILDVDPSRQQPQILNIELPESAGERQDPAQGPVDGQAYIASRLGARRQSFRSARQLLNRASLATSAAVGTLAADEWLARGRYRLLVGLPGAGKSSLLRFTATDLLSSRPQSVALQREHASDLPVWLPFGFLCRHLEASTENSLVSAAEAWLKSQSAAHLWPLVQRALQDDRLLLLIDGIDEWSDAGAAEHALGILEAFLGRTRASAILSTRPYAVDRLNWNRRWELAEITPLTDQQRRTIAAGILRPVTEPETEPAARPAWTAGVEPFLDQLAATPELGELSRSPLFLTLLATTWQGEPLPQQRFKIYTRLVELLVEKHPQMRMRASRARGALLPADEATALFAAVAYRLRVKDPAGAVTKPEMRKFIVESMTDDEVLGYAAPDARRIADAVLAMAEDEFGLIVSRGAGAVGFVHRVVLDHLAGQYLAALPAGEQSEAVQRFVHDPGWRDVLLAQLSAQVSPYATEQLLMAAVGTGGQRWADVDGYELAADALAAGVRLTPRSQARYMDRFVERVETHPALRHRANLITALAAMLTNHTARSRLLPVMKGWLTAPRPDPSPTMWVLRDLGIADEVAAEYLLWGLRHPEDSVKVNAALAVARRFAGEPRLVDQLVAFTETGPSSATQAAAILALGNGWAEAAETTRLIDWARQQPSVPLRLVGLDLLQRNSPPGAASPLRREERAWLLSLIRHEGLLPGPWPAAGLVNLAAAGDTQVADFALETLVTNGRNGGDRSLAWFLACNAFAGDSRFKTWVAAQLARPDQHGLILYNAAMIPQQWRDDPAFAQALGPYVDAELTGVTPYNVTGLAPAMPPEEARAALLGSLDSGRPYAAAATLAEQYLDDDHVRAALTSRLRGDRAHAAPMAGVAIDVLGPGEGFAVLVSLLRQPDQAERYEQRVVVAQAVADAWQRFENAVRKQDADAAPARDVLASYDPAELAALCTAVSPHPLMWHAPSVITAWPGQPAVQEFAAKLIRDPAPIVFGIPDTIPPAILRAYCDRTDEPSRKIFDEALSLLKHIEPELREVLAFELARSSLGVDDLVEVMAGWKDEPDTEVRRIAFIGLIQAITRHQHARDTVAGDHVLTAEMEWLRQEIRRDLCAYGPELEERRQLAWTGMLLLGDLTLIDGIEETIGHQGAPGVKLEVPYDGDVDQILIDLVAENWDRLRAHFGETVFERLNGKSDSQRRTAGEQRLHVMSALATAASRHPAIADMLRHEADTEPALRQDRHFLLWAKEENRGDEKTLRALAAKLGDTAHRWQDTVLDSLLDRESWNVTDDVFKAILTEDAAGGRPGRTYASGKLAAYTQLFPADSLTVTALGDLESWFRTDRATREPRGWGDTLAIALGAAEPQDLSAITTRVHTRIRMGMSDLYLPMFAKPLIRRLRADADAVEAFRAALSDPMGISEDSPIFAGPWDPIADAHADLQLLQRMYLFAVALRQAVALSQQDAASAIAVLAVASPDTVVHNPFTDHEGPLCLAVLDLASHLHAVSRAAAFLRQEGRDSTPSFSDRFARASGQGLRPDGDLGFLLGYVPAKLGEHRFNSIDELLHAPCSMLHACLASPRARRTPLRLPHGEAGDRSLAQSSLGESVCQRSDGVGHHVHDVLVSAGLPVIWPGCEDLPFFLLAPSALLSISVMPVPRARPQTAWRTLRLHFRGAGRRRPRASWGDRSRRGVGLFPRGLPSPSASFLPSRLGQRGSRRRCSPAGQPGEPQRHPRHRRPRTRSALLRHLALQARRDATRSPRHAISSPSAHSYPASLASPAAFTRSGIAWLTRLRWPSMSRTGASCRTTLSFRVIAISLLDPIPEDADTVAVSPAEMIVTAANGVRWRRLPGSTSSAEELLAVLAALGGDRIAREWSLWREGEPRRKDDRRHEVLFQWEHADPPPGPYLPAEELEAQFEARWAETQRQREARAAEYDHDRAMARLNLLSAKAHAGFMRHVLANPASDAQWDKATEFLAVAEQEIRALEAQVGDPDAIQDEHGHLPATRRGYNLDSHMRLFRHEALRAWSKGQRPRFRQLLAMPVPQAADMCPECQAPADWHTYAVSLRLFQPKPEPSSQAETIARLMPGWWERCPASTSIQIRQQWGQGLPDFDGAQWQAMLTPLLRAIFAPAPPRQREKPDRRAVLERRLRSAEAEARRIRRELGGLDPDTDEGRRQ